MNPEPILEMLKLITVRLQNIEAQLDVIQKRLMPDYEVYKSGELTEMEKYDV